MAAPQVFRLMQNMSGASWRDSARIATLRALRPEAQHQPGAVPHPSTSLQTKSPGKKVAREMMLLVRDLNPKVASAVGKSADATTRVGCVTCHRGVAVPKHLADILDDTTRDGGTPAAVAQFRDLRER